MAKMSQKELVEEGFSDKIRGIAKAAATGIKQAAQQGVNLDTGQLTKGMYKSYKGQQPIAVLKDTLAKSKDIEIVKIDKGNIKKQQASGKKGYLGRIVGPKSITLIPFEGTLLGKVETQKQYKGSGAGVMEAFAPEDAEVTDAPRDEKGRIKGVHKDGGVEKQINKLLLKHGVEESAAARLSPYAAHIRRPILQIIQKTHPQIKFTFNPRPELGGFDVEEAEPDIKEVKPDDYRERFESLSLRDVLRLSSFIILEKETDAELARLLGFKSRQEMRDAFREAGGKRKWLEQNPEAVKAAEALRRRKERGQDIGDKEKPKKKAAPKEKVVKGVDEWIEYVKEGGPENLKARIEEVKKSGMSTKEIGKVIDNVPKPAAEEPVYPGHEKFVASLDDKVVLDLLKLKQKIQPGLQIEFEDEKGVDISGVQGETGMFVAEIFRTKEGLQVGDIYRQGDPTDIVWSGGGAREKKKEVKLSPFDKAVETLTTKNNLRASTLVPALNKITGGKIDDVSVITKITGKKEGDRLSNDDIEKIKNELIKLKIIKEKSSQKILLRQLTSLSR